MKLSTALTFTISTLSLSSTVAIKSALRGGSRDGDFDLAGPFDSLKCTFEGFADESKCNDAKTPDGSNCSYCTMSSNGQKAGVCVDPQVASRMVQMNEEVSCTNTPTDIKVLDLDETVNKIPHRFMPIIDLGKCIFKGGQTQDQCFAVELPQEKHCGFCTTDTNGQKATMCVSQEVVDQFQASGQDITCVVPDFTLYEDFVDENEDETISFETLKNYFDKISFENPLSFHLQEEISESIPFFDSFKCAFNGGQTEDQCSNVELEGGRRCGLCKIESQGKEAAICVSPEAADQLMKSGQSITCTGGNPGVVSEMDNSEEDKEVEAINQKLADSSFSIDDISSSPVTDCNLKGTDRETCLDASKVNGSDCVWCDAGIGGFCFPKSWEGAAGHLLDCGKGVELKRNEADLAIE